MWWIEEDVFFLCHTRGTNALLITIQHSGNDDKMSRQEMMIRGEHRDKLVERDGWRGLVSIGVLPMWAEEERMPVKVRKRKEEASNEEDSGGGEYRCHGGAD